MKHNMKPLRIVQCLNHHKMHFFLCLIFKKLLDSGLISKGFYSIYPNTPAVEKQTAYRYVHAVLLFHVLSFKLFPFFLHDCTWIELQEHCCGGWPHTLMQHPKRSGNVALKSTSQCHFIVSSCIIHCWWTLLTVFWGTKGKIKIICTPFFGSCLTLSEIHSLFFMHLNVLPALLAFALPVLEQCV